MVVRFAVLGCKLVVGCTIIHQTIMLEIFNLRNESDRLILMGALDIDRTR